MTNKEEEKKSKWSRRLCKQTNKRRFALFCFCFFGFLPLLLFVGFTVPHTQNSHAGAKRSPNTPLWCLAIQNATKSECELRQNKHWQAGAKLARTHIAVTGRIEAAEGGLVSSRQRHPLPQSPTTMRVSERVKEGLSE